MQQGYYISSWFYYKIKQLLHYPVFCDIIRQLLHYQAIITLSGIYYIIRQLLHYQAVMKLSGVFITLSVVTVNIQCLTNNKFFMLTVYM